MRDDGPGNGIITNLWVLGILIRLPRKMEWSAVRPNSTAREGSAGRALKLACATLLCVAFVALSSHTVQPHHVTRPSTLPPPRKAPVLLALQRALAEIPPCAGQPP